MARSLYTIITSIIVWTFYISISFYIKIQILILDCKQIDLTECYLVRVYTRSSNHLLKKDAILIHPQYHYGRLLSNCKIPYKEKDSPVHFLSITYAVIRKSFLLFGPFNSNIIILDLLQFMKAIVQFKKKHRATIRLYLVLWISCQVTQD